jgi:hypothetical protein
MKTFEIISLEQHEANRQAEADHLEQPITYAEYLRRVLLERPETAVLDRAGWVEEILRCESVAWKKSHAFAAAYKQNGRNLGVPPSWRAHRERAIAELGGPSSDGGLECGSIYDSTAGRSGLGSIYEKGGG